MCLPYRADRITERRQIADLGEEAWAQARDVFRTFAPRLARLPLLLLEGHWDEFEELARTALGPTGFAGARRSFLPVLAAFARLRGEAATAWALIGEGLPDGLGAAPGDINFQSAVALQRVAAALALDADDPTTAGAWLDAHDRWLSWGGAVLGRAEGELGRAACALITNDCDVARRHAERALAHAADPRQPLALLAARRMLGQIAAAMGQPAAATEHLQATLALAEVCAAPHERALTLLALAAAHARAGERAAGELALTEVRAICAPLGAALTLGYAEALAAELRTNTTPRAPAAPPAGLSAREVEVLRLLVAGLSNRQIAERLTLSTPTVKNHVAHILAKTGADNRAAAATFALRHGLA